MRAIILAAGLGKRLGELTADRPKCLVPLLGEPLLKRQLAVLRSAGVTDIVLVGGYQADKLKSINLPLVVNRDYASTNMVTTLFCAEAYLSSEEDLIIAYGDIVYELRVLKELIKCKAPLTIAVDRNWREYWQQRMADPLEDAETLKMTDGNRIIELGKKAANYSEIEGQYLGLIKVAADWIEQFKQVWHEMDRNVNYDGKDFANMYMTSYLQHLIDRGWEARAALVEGGWLEIDTRSDLELYERLHKEGRLDRFYRP